MNRQTKLKSPDNKITEIVAVRLISAGRFENVEEAWAEAVAICTQTEAYGHLQPSTKKKGLEMEINQPSGSRSTQNTRQEINGTKPTPEQIRNFLERVAAFLNSIAPPFDTVAINEAHKAAATTDNPTQAAAAGAAWLKKRRETNTIFPALEPCNPLQPWAAPGHDAHESPEAIKNKSGCTRLRA